MMGPAFAKAFVLAQQQLARAEKDKQGQVGQQRYSYADLNAVWAACEEALRENGIGVLQSPGEYTASGIKTVRTDKSGELTESEIGTIFLTTRLIHESGEMEDFVMSIPVTQHNPQAAGSAITYARRYALGGIMGIRFEDDDAQSAMPPRGRQQQQARGKQEPPARQQKMGEAAGWMIALKKEMSIEPKVSWVAVAQQASGVKPADLPSAQKMVEDWVTQSDDYEQAAIDLVHNAREAAMNDMQA